MCLVVISAYRVDYETHCGDETAWLVDALNFVGDSPAKREKLLDAYRAAGNPVACRQTLVRVIKRAVFKMNMTDKCAYLHSSIVNLARKSAGRKYQKGC